MKKDDSSLNHSQLIRVRREARSLLERAEAIGQYPTPVHDLLSTAQVEVADGDTLDARFLARLRRRAGDALKSAVSKVLGLYDSLARLIHIDKGVVKGRQNFIKLHETGHAVLPWQRELYGVFEDCESTLDPEIKDLFEREANCFATEVLFQLDGFAKEANDHSFSIDVPLRIGKRFGASGYASVRRYVSESARACAVLVLNPPELKRSHGFECTLRRVVTSREFDATMGKQRWASHFTPDDPIGAMVPLGRRRMSKGRVLVLEDVNGIRHECMAEAFKTPYQIFVLVWLARPMTQSTIVLPEANG